MATFQLLSSAAARVIPDLGSGPFGPADRRPRRPHVEPGRGPARLRLSSPRDRQRAEAERQRLAVASRDPSAPSPPPRRPGSRRSGDRPGGRAARAPGTLCDRPGTPRRLPGRGRPVIIRSWRRTARTSRR